MACALAEKSMADHDRQVRQDAEPVAGSQQKALSTSKGAAPAVLFFVLLRARNSA